MAQLVTPEVGDTITYGVDTMKSQKLRPRCKDNWTFEIVCLTHQQGFTGSEAEAMQYHVNEYSDDATHKFVVHCSGHGWEAVPQK